MDHKAGTRTRYARARQLFYHHDVGMPLGPCAPEVLGDVGTQQAMLACEPPHLTRHHAIAPPLPMMCPHLLFDKAAHAGAKYLVFFGEERALEHAFTDQCRPSTETAATPR